MFFHRHRYVFLPAYLCFFIDIGMFFYKHTYDFPSKPVLQGVKPLPCVHSEGVVALLARCPMTFAAVSVCIARESGGGRRPGGPISWAPCSRFFREIHLLALLALLNKDKNAVFPPPERAIGKFSCRVLALFQWKAVPLHRFFGLHPIPRPAKGVSWGCGFARSAHIYNKV